MTAPTCAWGRWSCLRNENDIFVIGLVVLLLAIFDEWYIPLEIPASNNWVFPAKSANLCQT